MKSIDEKTLIPLGLVISIIGAILWLSSIYFETKSAADEIKSLKEENRELYRVFNTIDKRLSRIEGKLGIHGE